MGLDAFGAGPASGSSPSSTARRSAWRAPTRTPLFAGALGHARRRRPARPCPEPVRGRRSPRGPMIRGTGGAYTQHPARGQPRRRSTCSASRPTGGSCSAGEHTQSARLAYADGALTSGIREAKRLLGTPAVRLAVNHAVEGRLTCPRRWVFLRGRRRRPGGAGPVLVRPARRDRGHADWRRGVPRPVTDRGRPHGRVPAGGRRQAGQEPGAPRPGGGRPPTRRRRRSRSSAAAGSNRATPASSRASEWRCMADPEGSEFDIDVLPGS